MIIPLFAMPPRMMLAEWCLGLLIALTLAILVVRDARARDRPNGPRRRLGLMVLLLRNDPATGLALAPSRAAQAATTPWRRSVE